MNKQIDIYIDQMKFPDDKNEIASWQEKYADDKDFESIKHFILEDKTFVGLDEVIETNHEIFAIGDDERKYAFVAKNKTDEIIAWALVDFFDITTDSPEMFLQYFVVHPKYQHKGYGEAFASELFLNSKKYLGEQPKNYFGYVDKNNTASKHLLEKFGFKFKNVTPLFLKAETKQPKLETGYTPSSLGE